MLGMRRLISFGFCLQLLSACGAEDVTNETVSEYLRCGAGEEAIYTGRGWQCVDESNDDLKCVSSLYADRPLGSDLPVITTTINSVVVNELSETWQDFCGGGLSFDVTVQTTTGPEQFWSFSLGAAIFNDVVLKGGLLDKATYPPVPLTSANFSLDLTENAIRVAVGPVTFSPVPATDGRQHQYTIFQPGSPTFGDVEIVATKVAGDTRIRDWVIDAYNGIDARKDLTLKVMSHTGSTALTYVFKECLPIHYYDDGVEETITVKMNRTEFESGRPEFDNWVRNMMQGTSGTYQMLNVKISDSSEGLQFDRTYMDTFFTEYRFPVFDKNSNLALVDSFSFVPGYYEF